MYIFGYIRKNQGRTSEILIKMVAYRESIRIEERGQAGMEARAL